MRFAIPTADRVFVFTDHGVLIFKKNETLAKASFLTSQLWMQVNIVGLFVSTHTLITLSVFYDGDSLLVADVDDVVEFAWIMKEFQFLFNITKIWNIAFSSTFKFIITRFTFLLLILQKMDRSCPDKSCSYRYPCRKKPLKCPLCSALIGI